MPEEKKRGTKRQLKKLMGEGILGQEKLESLMNSKPAEEPKQRKQPLNPSGQAAALSDEEMICFLQASAEVLVPMFRIIFILLFTTGGRVHSYEFKYEIILYLF